jgi:hypothetical protein
MPIHEPFFKPSKGDLGLTKFTKPFLERLAPLPPSAEERPPNIVMFPLEVRA